jgi:DeoR family transcriptional regulator of aga operon
MESTTRPRRTSARRSLIIELVQRQQQVSVSDLSRQFGISAVSIRRDLDWLHDAGLLKRTHGGAQSLGGPSNTFFFDARLLKNVEHKRAIGQAAAALIQPGEVILLDSGTTVLEIARRLPRPTLEKGSLTVVTRSLSIAAELRAQRTLRLILLGGVYAPELDDFVGAQVESALQGLHVDTLFIGVDGVAAGRGLTTDNLLEVGIYRALVKCAGKVVVVADSSKIGASKMQALLPFEAIHTLITDTAAPQDFVQQLRDSGIQVILAPLP